MICDFCGNSDPTWTFRASGSLTAIVGEKTIINEDVGDGWTACDICAELIRTDKRPLLIMRSVSLFYVNNPGYSHAPIDVIRYMVEHQHAGFWKTKLDNGEHHIIRTEFGAQRTTCACETCINNCRNMPGMLLPSDLARMTVGVNDVEEWAMRNLLASPGALVRKTITGQIFRVRTLVPAVKEDGTCIHLTPENRCAIHGVAPFGCAFFDCGDNQPQGLAESGVLEILKAHREGEQYGELWEYLWSRGKRQHPPEVLREKMRSKAS